MQVFVQETVQPPVQETVQPPVQETVQPPVRAIITVSPSRNELTTWDRSGVMDISPLVANAIAAAGELNSAVSSLFKVFAVVANATPRERQINVSNRVSFFIGENKTGFERL